MEKKRRAEKCKRPWEAMKLDYVTSDKSYRQVADDWGIGFDLLRKTGANEGWVEQRQAHRKSAASHAIRKIEKKETNLLVKELSVADKLSEMLDEYLRDEKSFKLYIDREEVLIDGKKYWRQVEREFDRLDVKAIKEATDALREVERLKRSIHEVLTYKDRERLKIEREKLELEKQKMAQGLVEHEDVGIVEIPSVLPEKDTLEDLEDD